MGNDIKNKTILVTGGTGSFGKKFTRKALEFGAKKVIVFSRDERILYFIGDRDKGRLYRVFNEVDVVVQAA